MIFPAHQKTTRKSCRLGIEDGIPLTKDFCRVKFFKPRRATNKFVACKTSIGILQGEDDIYCIAHAFLRNKFRGIANQCLSEQLRKESETTLL